MEEIWKDIDGFDGIYQISNLGRVRSSKRTSKWYYMNLTNKKGRYLSVVLTRNDGKSKSVNVHSLVANVFVENKGMSRCIHHIDLNKQNNRASNLMWISNRDHAKLHSDISPERNEGIRRYTQEIRPRRILQISFEGELVGSFRNSFDAGKESGVCARNILQVASKTTYKGNKTRKQAGGYYWMFEDEYLEKANKSESIIF